jgi:hypothetical protein
LKDALRGGKREGVGFTRIIRLPVYRRVKCLARKGNLVDGLVDGRRLVDGLAALRSTKPNVADRYDGVDPRLVIGGPCRSRCCSTPLRRPRDRQHRLRETLAPG